MRAAVVVALLLSACGRFGFTDASDDVAGDDGGQRDGDTDGAVDPGFACTPMSTTTLTTTGERLGSSGARVASFVQLDDTTLAAAWADTAPAGGFGDVVYTTIALPSGTTTGLTALTSSSGDAESNPLLVRVPTGVIALWGSGGGGAVARLIDETGTAGPVQAVKDAEASAVYADIVWAGDSGAEVLVLSNDPRDGEVSMYLSRLDRATGAKIGADVDLFPSSMDIRLAAATKAGNELVIAYQPGADTTLTVGRRTVTGAQVGSDIDVSIENVGLPGAGLAAGDGQLALATSAGGPSEAAVTMLDGSGTPTGITRSLTPAPATWADSPSISPFGNDFVVAWREFGAMAYQRVDSTGQPVGTPVKETAPDTGNIDISVLSSGAAVTWATGPSGSASLKLVVLCP